MGLVFVTEATELKIIGKSVSSHLELNGRILEQAFFDSGKTVLLLSPLTHSGKVGSQPVTQ
jgi:hypothetical protein